MCVPAGTSTPTRLGAIIAGFARSPSTVTVQRGSYVALSSTTAGRRASTVVSKRPS
jgi:hypothetical protein